VGCFRQGQSFDFGSFFMINSDIAIIRCQNWVLGSHCQGWNQQIAKHKQLLTMPDNSWTKRQKHYFFNPAKKKIFVMLTKTYLKGFLVELKKLFL
jgi:hypothetical protein